MTDPRAVTCAILALALLTALLGLLDPGATSAQTVHLVEEAEVAITDPPLPPAMLYKTLSPEAAATYNASLPFTAGPNVPAKPFRLDPHSADYARSLDCLADAAYYEASGEGPAGEAAVVQVVLNRVRHPAFPASICAVVYQGSTRSTGCQFTFTCDGSLLRQRDAREWNTAQAVAAAALSGTVFAPVGLATHYHAESVVPYWAGTLAKNAQVGAHMFYRWPGSWGRPPAFRQHYRGEPWQEAQLRNAALIAHGHAPEVDSGPAVAVIVKADPTRPEPLAAVKLLTAAAPLAGALEPQQASFAERSAADKRFSVALFSTLRDIQAYSGVPVGSLAITVPAALPGSPVAECAAVRPPAASRRVRASASARSAEDTLGTRLGEAAADYLIWAAQAEDSATPTPTSCASAINQQVVAAMLSRMIALRSGEAAGERQVAWEVRHGHDLVPLLVQRLKMFEASRDKFVTLSPAYAALIAGLSTAPVQAPIMPVAEASPSSGQPGPEASLAGRPGKSAGQLPATVAS